MTQQLPERRIRYEREIQILVRDLIASFSWKHIVFRGASVKTTVDSSKNITLLHLTEQSAVVSKVATLKPIVDYSLLPICNFLLKVYLGDSF